MTVTTARFAIPSPGRDDTPDLAAQGAAQNAVLESRLGYAGAQGGKSIVATEESTASTSYTLLTTPDRVQNLVIENDGDLLFVYFSALMKHASGSSISYAAIHLTNQAGPTTTQLKTVNSGGAPTVEEASHSILDYDWVVSSPAGLILPATGAGDATDVTTGLVTGGGVCVIEQLAAGTYDVSVRFKASASSTFAKRRRLFAWTKEFPTSGI